ncbi:Glycosyltransferase involved in cell wall bisynthesis [Raineyella antarctica]|uniref:Glycosyltransferase involved in cell wall bisynthesis n=1 Tax=Raineyella antarctica TaxID=1577474 RepID=A0A1G6GEX2_9ACTN|nr:glycosyltransferase [Raineyella antarctica]SDB80393.1 Glycosyltransferase involved in cell wall bisynthesis [Raineyella antarctica]
MRVLHINAVAGRGSTGRLCDEISQRLSELGDEAYVAYSVGGDGAGRIRIGSRLDAKLHALFSRVSGMQGYFSKRATATLLADIRKLRPDVVHLHNLHANYVNLGMLLSYLGQEDIPTVITLHDCWFMTGKCTHYVSVGCQRWEAECGECPLLRADNPSWLFDRTARMKLDKMNWFEAIPRLAVVGVSDWITKEARASHLASAPILTRIYNWVDRAVFFPDAAGVTRERLGIPDGDTMVLGVASGWSEKKGLGEFVELARLNPDFRVTLVGSIADAENLPKNVVSVGPLADPSQLRRLYSAADVFVSLSEAETFGLVTVEALACGTPAVVMNSTASPELVADGCGTVVEPGDIEGLSQAIRAHAATGKSSFLETCVESVERRFDPTVQIDEYVDLYRRLCAMLSLGK